LADLVRDDGDVDVRERVAVIASKPAGAVAQLAVSVAHERGELRAARDLRGIRPAGGGGVEAAVVVGVIRGRPLGREA